MTMNTKKATSIPKDVAPRRFVFLLLDRFTMLSFAGALEPLRIANRMLGFTAYEWVLVGDGGVSIACSNGASFKLDSGLTEVSRDDTILVCGGIDVQRAATKTILNWLRREARRGVAMGGALHRGLCLGQSWIAGR
jgi:transcriptional regulator GlxA family with amidase domain